MISLKVVTLVENDTIDNKLAPVHGLSLYIETSNKKILFDIGQKGQYLKNAKKLAIDIKDVDYLVISHGHYDHGQGIQKFLKLNEKAEVFVSMYAFEDHVKVVGNDYNKLGIKKPSRKTERVHYINETTEITPEIIIYNNVDFQKQVIGDKALKAYIDGRFVDDEFDHEIYMVVTEKTNQVLFSGCSHKGIENIIDTLEKRNNLKFTHIIGGYHFSHYDPFDFKQTDYLQALADKFKERKNTSFYTGHCTGDEAVFELKQKLKNKLVRFKTGTTFEI